MARLTAAQRKRIPRGKYGLPAQRKYPMPDKPHARAAKSRASEEYHKGVITLEQKNEIDRKADRVLRGK